MGRGRICMGKDWPELDIDLPYRGSLAVGRFYTKGSPPIGGDWNRYGRRNRYSLGIPPFRLKTARVLGR